MNTSKMLLKVEARIQHIWNEINNTDTETLDYLIVSPPNVQNALDSINEGIIIEQLTTELQQAVDAINTAGITYEAITYEWSHDSYDAKNCAIGKAYEKSVYNFLSNGDTGPNNSWTVVDSGKPTFTGQELRLPPLSVYLVMNVWYTLLAKVKEINKVRDNDVYDNMTMVMYDELFKLKLFTLLDTAYTKVTGNKPGYFCVSVYGYWHSEITAYKIEVHEATSGFLL